MIAAGTAFVTLCVARLRLRVAGVGRTLAWATPHTAPAEGAGAGSVEEAIRCARTVALAGALFPGRARCLEQSLTLSRLLRARGIPAELRFGIRPHPFAAHAWVEVEGHPLLEDPERLATFQPMTRP